MTLDDLHARLRRKVHEVFAMEVMTPDDRQWRLSSLRSVYEDFGERADLLRGISLYDPEDDEGDMGGMK